MRWLYHQLMRDEVLRYIRHRRLIHAGDRVLAAVSGGADSVALLRMLLEVQRELGIVLAIAHFNHGLRGVESEADEHFIAELAKRYELDFFVGRGQVAEHATAEGMGLESAGRELRYDWLTNLAAIKRFDAVATAHTLDDQAETVLMKFLRGAGSRGLAGIYPLVLRSSDKGIRLVRPLLGISRAEIEAYLEALEQPWREDESNLDRRFLRNRVRHDLLPLLEREYNPNVREVLSETAEISRGEEEYWKPRAEEALNRLRTGTNKIQAAGFAALAEAMQRRVLRRFIDDLGIPVEFQYVERLRLCALGELRRAELSDGWYAEFEGECLVLRQPAGERRGSSYQFQVPVPGEVELLDIGYTLRIVPVPAQFAADADPGTLLRAELIAGEVVIRNWLPGDRYQAAYTGSEHKLKTLFLERKIPARERALWPVMVKGSDIVWVHGLPVADAYCWRVGDGNALRVDCIPTSMQR